VSTLSAQQQAQPAQKHEFKVAIGDSVMIKRECQKYCTGETPSTWVWDKVHTVRQLGTKRFPDGVLLMNIYSWMCEDCLIPVNGRAEEAAAQAAEEQKEEKAVFESQTQAERDSIAEAAEKARLAAAAAAAKEAEEAAAAETAKADSIAAEQQAQQTSQGDSIHSKQNFKKSYDRFTIGLRGGASALMHKADKGKWTCGGDVLLDLQYDHYWAKDGRPVDLGIIVGLGIGYHQSGLKTAYDSTGFQRPDPYVATDNINYTVVARDVKETDRQLQLEVPLMFSLIHDNGLFFNVGPKLMIPVYTPYKQSVNKEGTQISAYFEKTGITMVDNPVTGRYDGQQPEEKNGIQFNLNLMLTAEIGYEWILKSGNSLGLGAYANYGWNLTYKNQTNSEGLFNLTAPTNTSKANLEVLSATHAYADKLSFFDVGVKLAYHFNFPKKRYFKDSKLF
jgi:hypothetical protein